MVNTYLPSVVGKETITVNKEEPVLLVQAILPVQLSFFCHCIVPTQQGSLTEESSQKSPQDRWNLQSKYSAVVGCIENSWIQPKAWQEDQNWWGVYHMTIELGIRACMHCLRCCTKRCRRGISFSSTRFSMLICPSRCEYTNSSNFFKPNLPSCYTKFLSNIPEGCDQAHLI